MTPSCRCRTTGTRSTPTEGARSFSHAGKIQSQHGLKAASSNAQPGTFGPCVGPYGVNLSRPGAVPSLWSHMGGSPLGCLPRALLGNPSAEMGEANLPPNLIRDLGKIPGRPLCRLLGQIVCCLVASHALVSRDPVDHDSILPGHEACTHLWHSPCPLLAWA